MVAASVRRTQRSGRGQVGVLVFALQPMVLLPVRSVIQYSALQHCLHAEMMFQVWPPLLLFAIASQVPKLFAVPTVNGV